jgi:hypothetical protein
MLTVVAGARKRLQPVLPPAGRRSIFGKALDRVGKLATSAQCGFSTVFDIKGL